SFGSAASIWPGFASWPRVNATVWPETVSFPAGWDSGVGTAPSDGAIAIAPTASGTASGTASAVSLIHLPRVTMDPTLRQYAAPMHQVNPQSLSAPIHAGSLAPPGDGHRLRELAQDPPPEIVS